MNVPIASKCPSLAVLAAALSLLACNATVQGSSPVDFSTPDQRRVPDGSINLPELLKSGCATATAQANQVPLYMLVILDGSGSMAQNGKWQAVTAALESIFTDLASQANTSVGVGLTVFGDHLDTTIQPNWAGPYNKMDVPLAYVDNTQLGELNGYLNADAPYLGTPTYEVLHGQYPLLQAFTPTAPLLPGGKRIAVLMTDGVPDTDMPAGQAEVPDSLDICQQMDNQTPPLPTFVVGVGHFPPIADEYYSPGFLGQMAVNGGTRRSPTCNPNETMDPTNLCYFQITPPMEGSPSLSEIDMLTDSFVSALGLIRQEAVVCEYTLESLSGGTGQLDPSSVNVVYDDGSGNQSLVAENATNGWTYDNPDSPTKVILHGSACTQVKGNAKARITVVLGCQTVLG